MAHITCNFLSYSLNRAVNVDLILPSLVGPELNGAEPLKNSHQPKAKYPILYLLHGAINDYSTWERYTSIERYAEINQIAVVTFSAENQSYINVPGTPFTAAPFYDFVRYELPDFLSNLFPIDTTPEHSYIAGLSMGGSGTMLHAFTHPEDYAAAGVFSMSLKRREGHFLGDTWNNETFLREAVAAGKKLPPLYTSCGMDDHLYPLWKESLPIFEELGVDVTTCECPGFAHEWPFWDQEIQKFLAWIPRTDFYAEGGRTRKV